MKKHRRTWAAAMAASLGLTMAASGAAFQVPDPGLTNYFWATGIGFPPQKREKTFAAGERNANFTFFSGVKDQQTENGVLRFTLATNKAVLGWGNFMGKQPVAEIADMWEYQNSPILNVSQTGTNSRWAVRFWTDGKRQRAAPVSAVLTGNVRTNLEFKAGGQTPTPDGMEFEIEGEPGTRFEIASVKLVNLIHEGYCRKEFDLPTGQVWRAIAEIGGKAGEKKNGVFTQDGTILYVNGHEVKRRSWIHTYNTVSVDIAPYLKPGKNVVGIAVRYGAYNALIYFQTKVIMVSGATAVWQADLTWKYAPREEKGWDQPGFNDAAWTPVIRGYQVFDAGNGRDSSGQLCLAEDHSRLQIKNPLQAKLFYDETQDVQVTILTPAGLQGQKPALEYTLGKADAEGLSAPVTDGRQPAFTVANNSLAYAVNLGCRPRGVYTMALRLTDAAGKVIEERPREPLVVIGRLSTRQIEGRDDFEGLDADLEDTIDFTNPADPHPWVAACPGNPVSLPAVEIKTPTIVTTNGMTYRETADRRSAFFSYRIGEFKHPGSFYLLELEYPDDADRLIEVSISSKATNVWSNSRSGVGAETGGKLYKTGKIQTLRWIHVAGTGIHSVDVISGANDLKAAAKSLKIYRIKGELPSIGSGTNRAFGLHTERCYYTSGIGMNFGGAGHYERKLSSHHDVLQAERQLPILQRFIRDLVWMRDTTERYAQYLKFSGQNFHIMGVYQYNEPNTPMAHPAETDTARAPYSMKSMLAHTLDANGIDVYAGVEWSQFSFLSTVANNAQVAKGADTIWMVNDKGEQYYGNDLSTVVPKWMHPRNRQQFQDLMREIGDKFGSLRRFRGVHFLVSVDQGRTGYWIPGFAIDHQHPLAYSYDDVSFAQFETTLRTPLPIRKDDPARFAKRAALVAGNDGLRQQFIAWRCRQVKGFLEDGLAALREKRSDAVWVNAITALDNPLFLKAWETSGRPYADFLKDFGIDLALLNTASNMWNGRWTRSQWSNRQPYHWLPRVDARIIGPYNQECNRYVFVRSSWDENRAPFAGAFLYQRDGCQLVQSDWVLNNHHVRVLPQPAHRHCREALIQALITGDPDIIGFGFNDLNIVVGNEQYLREFARVYTHLPQEKFAAVLNTGLESNLAIRQLTKDGISYVYLANPAYWTIKGKITVTAAGEIRDLVSGRPLAVEQKAGRLILPVTLDPYGLMAFTISEPLAVSGKLSTDQQSKIQNPKSKITIESYTTDPIAPAEQAYLQDIMARVNTLLADPAIKLALAPVDREFMAEILKQAQAALDAGQYAQCWARLTDTRFWTLWQEFLEKAVLYQAFLPPEIEKEPLKKNSAGLRVITAVKTPEAIIPDGNLDDPAWRRVKFQTDFADDEGKPGLTETGVKALYDDQAIYLGFICADKNVGAIKAFDTFSFTSDDVLAVFIQPDEQQSVYYQIGTNTKGVQFHQKVIGGERIYQPLPAWKPAIAIGEKYWTAEMVLPYNTFGLTGRGAATWRINCFRVFRGSAIKNIFWTGGVGHHPEKFGVLEFQ